MNLGWVTEPSHSPLVLLLTSEHQNSLLEVPFLKSVFEDHVFGPKSSALFKGVLQPWFP